MSLVVASTSTVATNNAADLTITKPSGVAVGDLLVIMAAAEHDGNDGLGDARITCSGFTEGVQAAREGNNSNTDLNVSCALLWKIADSGDVSASNYTISDENGTEGLGIAVMLRITGWTSGNPIWASRGTNTSYIETTGLTLSRPYPQLLLMMSAIKQDTEEYNFASPAIYSASSNPTWTEVYDNWVTVNASSDGRVISAAFYYANSSDTTTITGYETVASTIAGGGSTGSASGVGLIAVIVEPTNVTTDVSHLAITPTLEGVTASQVNVVTDLSHLAVIPTLNGVTSKLNNRLWQNEDKPTVSDVINLDKP